ncbi:hypothetical protein NIES4071_106200 (plasmid) [Calothrix sp. NIES-4071]|nr:hypothetical protein NIES4071_106200 [Calothrix sp. NIES-4071]BAZ65038.1 hypothetical protein NIES4105_107710 [Calothrix sp. NIES-4105]
MNFFKTSLFFTITAITSLSTLINPVFASTLVSFSSSIRYGNAGANENLELSTLNARDVNLLSKDLNLKLSIGTEGSAVKFTNLTIGNSYVFDWTLATQETRGEDIFYLFDGTSLTALGTSRIATQNVGGGWRVAPKVQTTEFRVQSSNVMLILLDTRDKSFTSIVKINKLRRVPEGSAVLGILSLVVIGIYRVKKGTRI